MGKVKKKLPTPDTNPVDGDKLIEETKPKKENFNLSKRELKRRIDYLDTKLTDLIDIVDQMSSDLNRVMNRMGL